MSLLVSFNSNHVEPVEASPELQRIISGDPKWRSWLHFSEGDMTSGEWESTPGNWTIAYDKWEFFHILSGRGVVRGSDGSEIQLAPGAAGVIPPGFTGTWEVKETMRKRFFVRRVPADRGP
ncbi:MAG TPA: cupin domain-containing protein [Pseudolabrys sp.]|nr:cupin domain-containing protein [Pseudolabrys sp.]